MHQPPGGWGPQHGYPPQYPPRQPPGYGYPQPPQQPKAKAPVGILAAVLGLWLLVGLVAVVGFCASLAKQSPTSTAATASATTPGAHIPYHIAATYQKAGIKTALVVVSQGITRRDLAQLGRQLRDSQKAKFYRIFDDAAGIEAYRLWSLRYPDPEFPFPKEWMALHHLADVARRYDGGNSYWVVTDEQKFTPESPLD